MAARSASDEHYVLDMCDEMLGTAYQRQATFDWLRCDPPPNRPLVTLTDAAALNEGAFGKLTEALTRESEFVRLIGEHLSESRRMRMTEEDGSAKEDS